MIVHVLHVCHLHHVYHVYHVLHHVCHVLPFQSRVTLPRLDSASGTRSLNIGLVTPDLALQIQDPLLHTCAPQHQSVSMSHAHIHIYIRIRTCTHTRLHNNRSPKLQRIRLGISHSTPAAYLQPAAFLPEQDRAR